MRNPMPISTPGTTAAKNKSPMDVCVVTPYMMMAILGGIMSPMLPAAATIAAENSTS